MIIMTPLRLGGLLLILLAFFTTTSLQAVKKGASSVGRRTTRPSSSSTGKPLRPSPAGGRGAGGPPRKKRPGAGAGSAKRSFDDDDDDEGDEGGLSAAGSRAARSRRPAGKAEASFGKRASTAKSKRIEEEDEEDDEEEEDEFGYDEEEEEDDFDDVPRRRGGKKGRGRRIDNSRALVRGPKVYPVMREPLQQRMMRNVYSLTEKVQGIASKGKKLSREFKEYFSGDWETLLLRATRPDDKRPDSKYIRMVLDASSHFIRDEDVTSSNNPFRVTLRKLWAKMAEKDWRTTLKALLLFHILFRELDPEDVRIYRKIFLKMNRELCKKTKDKYFNLDRVVDVEFAENEKANRAFLNRYAKYVLQRAKTFTSKFEEMKVIGQPGIRPKEVLAQLLKAEKVLASGLACALDQSEESEVTIACLELVARDVYDLFRLFQEKLVNVTETPSLLEGLDETETSSVLASLQASYKSFYPRVQDFLEQSADLLAMYGFKIKTKLEPRHDFDAPRQEKAASSPAEEDDPISVVSSSPSVEDEEGASSSPSTTTTTTGASTGVGGTSSWKKRSGMKGESSIEEGMVDDHLTPYDDATPWDQTLEARGRAQAASAAAARRQAAASRAAAEDEEDDEDQENDDDDDEED